VAVGSLIAELNRRRVIRALVGYGIAAFAVLQIIEPVMHGLHWSEAVLSYVVVALALGFPLVVSLAWIFDVKAGRIERTAAGGQPGLRGVALALLLVGIGLAAAAPGVLYYFVFRSKAETASAGAPSVAVLPFVNMSSDKEAEYFSDGITEELINALANIEGLRVASRTGVFSLKGKSLGVQQIGAELNVSTLLEGSIRREGNALRVTAQLINVSDGYHLWSKSYDREVKSVFALEDEIARSIAQALQHKLVGQAVKTPTTNLEAHDLYLKGRYFWNKRNAEALRQAASYFQQAIDKDPAYALAYVGLADALTLRVEYDVVPGSEFMPKAKAAARRALELDPGLAEAHASLGLIATHDYDWTMAMDHLRRAIELKPDYAMARMWYGTVLGATGRQQEARDELERAQQLDPTSLVINLNLASSYLINRDYERSVKEVQKTLELDPGFEFAHIALARIYSAQGKHAQALEELDKIRSAPAIRTQAVRAYHLALSGRRAEALSLVQDLEERSGREYVPAGGRAAVWMALGDKDRAFALFEKACAQRAPLLRSLKWNPMIDSLRSDPRFTELLKCAHLE
jgi:TolB-like protein/Flp pilus assembly protein TadD